MRKRVLYIMLQKNAKGFIDVHMNAAISAFERIRDSRQIFRDRTISIFTFLLALLGIIITLQSRTDVTFVQLYTGSKVIIQISFVFSALLSIILFGIIFSLNRSYDLDNVFNTFNTRVNELESSGDETKPIYLFDNKLIVDEEYFAKVLLIRAYSDATDKIKKTLEKLGILYVITLVMLLTTIILSIIIGFKIL